MKKKSILLPMLFGTLLCGLVLAFVFSKKDAYAQTADLPRQLVSRTAKTDAIKTSAATSAGSARFSSAAHQNARLRNNLAWVFGGRTQTGWNIYVPLIAHTIGTDTSPDSADFAESLAKWQAKFSVQPTGILDRATLEAFTKFWQSQRLFRSNSPGEDRLLSAPIADFFDPSRGPELLKLERDTYSAYRRMIAAAAKDLGKDVRFMPNGELATGEKFLRIVSAYRSPEYQAALRKKEPNAGRAALAKNSPHSTGQALDIYVGGEPVTTKDPNRLLQVQTPAYRWLVKNAHRFGFYPYFYEPWHWEYVPGR